MKIESVPGCHDCFWFYFSSDEKVVRGFQSSKANLKQTRITLDAQVKSA